MFAGRPNVYGSVFRFEGQASVFAAPGRALLSLPSSRAAAARPDSELRRGAACWACCPGFIGTIQATEAIKLLTGIGQPLVGRLLLYDALQMRLREIALPRDAACPVCGDAPTIRELVAYDFSCEPEGDAMTVDELRAWRAEGRPHVLIDVREPYEHATANIDGAVLIPMGELPGRTGDLPRDRPVVVHCQTGARSARATAMLRAGGRGRPEPGGRDTGLESA